MRATQILEREHRSILSIVEGCRVFAEDLKRGEKVPANALQNVVEFFRIYGSQRHHREEQWLLSTLQGKGLHEGDCLLTMFKEEHRKIACMVEELAGYVSNYAQSGGDQATKVADTLHSLAELYSSHIWKEDNILLPFADKLFSDSEQQRLSEIFQMVTSGREQEAIYANEQASGSIKEWTRAMHRDKRSTWLPILYGL
ncbi:MAG TPA: hemerythrin domain-containing protein [Terriglobales bacterium]|nr:hemerythrin domain-containing protein [Terriglobales bacterium]